MVCCFIFLILYCEVCRKRIVEESLYFRYASEPFLNKLWCCDKKNAGNLELQDFWRLRAGDERIELPPKVLETPIIPFDQSPMFCFCCNYTYKRNSCQGKINKNCTKSTIKRRWRDLNPRTGCPAYRISSVLLPTHFSRFWEKMPHFKGKCSCPQKDDFLSASAVSDSSKCERTIGEN